MFRALIDNYMLKYGYEYTQIEENIQNSKVIIHKLTGTSKNINIYIYLI